jgi:hypothetical protein
MKRKIIAFTGAGGTGKTTLAEKIGRNVPSMVNFLRKEIYGEKSSYGDLNNFDEIYKFQIGIIYSQIAIEKYLFDYYKDVNYIIPIERSSLDYAAYMLNLAEKYAKSATKAKLIKDYVDLCLEHANKHYDAIVYFPIGMFEPDDVQGSSKERDEKSIKKTDNYISALTTRVKIPVFKLKSVNLEKRAKELHGIYKKINN